MKTSVLVICWSSSLIAVASLLGPPIRPLQRRLRCTIRPPLIAPKKRRQMRNSSRAR